MNHAAALIIALLMLVAACDVMPKRIEPKKVTEFQLQGCPLHLLTNTIADLGNGRKEIWLQIDYRKNGCEITKKMPPASTYALVQARFDCASREVSVKKYMLMGVGEKVLGEVNDVREFEKFREQTLADYIHGQHLCI